MASSTPPLVQTSGHQADIGAPRPPRKRQRWVERLESQKRFGAIWVLALLVLIFSVLAPTTFLTALTFKTILSNGAIQGLLALGVIFPLVTGILDLSIANVAGFSMMLSAVLSANLKWGTFPIVIVALAASAAFGLVSGLIVSKLRVNSLLATLGMGTIALSLSELVANNNEIIPPFGPHFADFGRGYLFGVPYSFLYVIGLAAVLFYVLEYTVLGRRLQAVGGNATAASLSGIRVPRLQLGVLVFSGLVGGFVGLVLATQLGVADTSTAPAFLLPAAATLFLGATILKKGPNPWGTVIACLLLATGTKGLELLGAQPWVSDFFNGAVLLVAVAISGSDLELFR